MKQSPNNQTEHYEVESILGKGGMGVVYLAYDKRLDRKVAIKCIRQNRANELWVSAVQEEAKLLAQINHTNIVQIYDLIEWQGTPALVMEYVQGRTLLEWLCSEELRNGELSLETRVDWLRQIAEGLACAHDKGIIHRDLKPENVMISASGQVKIMDFGIARHQAQPQAANIHDSQALPGEYIGSPASLSPEQALGDNLTTASDIFSFGILAYSLLCKHHPFGDTQDPDGILHAILYRAPYSVQVEEDTNNALQPFSALLIQCLDKDPSGRPSAYNCAKKLNVPLASTNENTNQEQPPVIVKADNTPWLYAVLAAAVALVCVIWLTYDNHKPLQLLAVQEPVITFNNTEGVAQTRHLQVAVDNALQESLLSQPHIQLIDRQEWQHANTKKAKDINAITGAKRVIRPTVDCQANRCQIELVLIDAEASTIISKQSWPVFLSNEPDIYYTTWQHALVLVGSKEQSPAAINPATYQTYINTLEIFNTAAQLDDQAFQSLVQIIQNDANFIPAYRILVNAAVANHDFHNEGGQIKQAHTLLTKNQQYIDEAIFAELKSLIYISLRQFGEAEAFIKKVRALGNIERHLQLTAKLASRDNDFEKAASIYQALLETRVSVALLSDLAAAQYLQGNYKQSIGTLNALLKISPDHTPGNSLIAGLSIATGEISSAIEAYHRLIEKQPDSTELNNLATAYMLAGDYSSAQKYQEKALEISPNRPAFFLNMGEIYLLNGSINEAEYFFQGALKKFGTARDIDTLVSISTANIHLGDLDQAKKTITAAKELDSGYADLLYAETLLFLKTNETAKAMANISQLLELGYTPIWFTLPWFSTLCTDTNFQTLTQETATNFCATVNISIGTKVGE